MKKIARCIVKYRLIFAIAFAVLAAVSIYLLTLVKQNYDMTKYLQDDTDTKRGLAVMTEEFGLNNNVLIMLGMAESEVGNMKRKLSNIEGVQLVSLDSYKDGKALFIVTLYGDEYSADTKATVERIKSLLSEEDYLLSGSSVANMGLENSLKIEIPIILVIALVIIFFVLILTSHSWFEPIIFALVLLCSVLINMGTNIIFGEISYVTFAVSAILQIALAMDYSIILLHGYTDFKEKGMSNEDALIEALAQNMQPISSSGLTTIAGLIALLFMSFTIGFDIGMVLAKGIFVSLLCVFLFMPALILLFPKLLEKTKHKPLALGGGGVAKISVSLRAVLAILMVVVIGGSFILQLGNTYAFTGWDPSNNGEIIADTFGNANQAVVIIDNEYADDRDAQGKFEASISELKNGNEDPAFKSIRSWTNLELTFEDLTDNIGFDTNVVKPLANAILGENATTSDVVELWNVCGGNIYDIKLSEQAVALVLDKDATDRSFQLAYSLFKEGGVVTLGSMVNKLYELSEGNSSDVLGEDLTPEKKALIDIMYLHRDEIAAAMYNILSPIIVGSPMAEDAADEEDEAEGEIDTLEEATPDEEGADDEENVIMVGGLVDKYGADTLIYDIDLELNGLFTVLCNTLFAEDNFNVSEFYKMWTASGGTFADFVISEDIVRSVIKYVTRDEPPDWLRELLLSSDTVLKTFMSAVSSDGDVTIGEFVKYVYENRERKVIKRELGDRLVGVCVMIYLTYELYLPELDERVTTLLGTLRSTFVGPNHSRIILLMDLPKDDDATFTVIDLVKVNANKYFGKELGKENYVAGESMTVKDISEAFESDLIKINLATVISIFLIIAILFRSILLPLLLVFVIQGAIWITMAICALFDMPIFFMSYIICICIQMGATIDYGILIAGNYRRNRATMNRLDAIVSSVRSAMPTVLTSGLILISSGFIVGFVSSVMPIYSIGRLLGLGTIISVLLILFLLPGLLYLFDKLISFTTWDGVKPIKDDPKPKKKHKKVKAMAVASGGNEAEEHNELNEIKAEEPDETNESEDIEHIE